MHAPVRTCRGGRGLTLHVADAMPEASPLRSPSAMLDLISPALPFPHNVWPARRPPSPRPGVALGCPASILEDAESESATSRTHVQSRIANNCVVHDGRLPAPKLSAPMIGNRE